MTSDSPRFVRADAVLSREVESALLLLAPDHGGVVALSGTGPIIWAMLREPHSVGELVHRLAQRFDVPAEQIEADVHAAVDSLRSANVIRADAA